jgi:hypothetical protein
VCFKLKYFLLFKKNKMNDQIKTKSSDSLISSSTNTTTTTTTTTATTSSSSNSILESKEINILNPRNTQRHHHHHHHHHHHKNNRNNNNNNNNNKNNKHQILLCKKHHQQQQQQKDYNDLSVIYETTTELFKCKLCTRSYPIHVDASLDGEDRYKKQSKKTNDRIILFTPPPNITFNIKAK